MTFRERRACRRCGLPDFGVWPSDHRRTARGRDAERSNWPVAHVAFRERNALIRRTLSHEKRSDLRP